MENRIGKRFGLAIWVALLSVLGVGCLFFVATAQDALTEDITKRIEAAAYDPDVAAGVVRDAVANRPLQVAPIVRAALQAAPHLSATLTAAAVVPASDHVASIQQAAADAVPRQARVVALAAKIAAKVVVHPERDTDIVSAAIDEMPGQSTTVVTAVATVCKLVEGCSPTPPMPIVKAAVAADRQAAEGIVEVAVSLFPRAASEIIAAATQRAVTTKTARRRAEPMQAADVTNPLPVSDRTPAPDAVSVARPTQPGAEAPVIVAENTPVSEATNVVLPPAPTPSDFPTPTSSGTGDGSGSGDDDDGDDDDDDDGDGTGTGTGTVPDVPDVPPVFPASPFM